MIEDLKRKVEKYIDQVIEIEICLSLGKNKEEFKRAFNMKIRDEVKNNAAVYLFENADSKDLDVLYIGMAGKTDRKGDVKPHRVRNRLIASRGRNSYGAEIQTNEFFYLLLTNPNELKMKKYTHVNKSYQKIVIHVLYCKEGVPASFLESILLFKYFKENEVLPLLNVSF